MRPLFSLRFVEMIRIRRAAEHDHVAFRVGLQGRERFADDLVDFAARFFAADRTEGTLRVCVAVRLDLG